MIMKLKDFMNDNTDESDDIVNEASSTKDVEYFLQTASIDILVGIVSKKFDMVKFARKELNNRYLDDNGKWQRRK